MKFSVGDRIKIKSTGESGEIVNIHEDFFLDVLIDGDQEPIPVPREQVDYSFAGIYKRHQEQKLAKQKVYIDNLKIEKSSEKKYDLDSGFYLIFRPVYREFEGDEIINRFDIYVYNQLDYELNFAVKISKGGKALFNHKGNLPTDGDFILFSMPFDDVTDNPVFSFAFSQKKQSEKVFREFKLSRKRLMQELTKMDSNDFALFHILIIKQLEVKSDFRISQEKLDEILTSTTPSLERPNSNSVQKAKDYVDLHIEKICPEFDLLTKDEMLAFQLDVFQKELDLAWADSRIHMFTVVHGLGDGILQERIRKMCNKIRFVSNCKQDFRNPGQSLIFFKNS